MSTMTSVIGAVAGDGGRSAGRRVERPPLALSATPLSERYGRDGRRARRAAAAASR